MSAILIDTLKLARRLEEAGFSREQAAGTAQTFSDEVATDIATKSDLLARTAELRGEIAGVQGEIAAMKAELKGDIAIVRTEIAALRTSTANWIFTAVLFNGVLLLGVAATLYSLLRAAIGGHP